MPLWGLPKSQQPPLTLLASSFVLAFCSTHPPGSDLAPLVLGILHGSRTNSKFLTWHSGPQKSLLVYFQLQILSKILFHTYHVIPCLSISASASSLLLESLPSPPPTPHSFLRTYLRSHLSTPGETHSHINADDGNHHKFFLWSI